MPPWSSATDGFDGDVASVVFASFASSVVVDDALFVAGCVLR